MNFRKEGSFFENNEKKDEVLINCCGMPLFFGKKGVFP